MSFHIAELNEEVAAKQRPIVIITSNSEKELPDAFLRRCIFYYIQFPDEDMMERSSGYTIPTSRRRWSGSASRSFIWIRQVDGLRKKPSTSELLDWIKALAMGGVNVDRISSELPFLGTLLKTEQDTEKVGRVASGSSTGFRRRF